MLLETVGDPASVVTRPVAMTPFESCYFGGSGAAGAGGGSNEDGRNTSGAGRNAGGGAAGYRPLKGSAKSLVFWTDTTIFSSV